MVYMTFYVHVRLCAYVRLLFDSLGWKSAALWYTCSFQCTKRSNIHYQMIDTHFSKGIQCGVGSRSFSLVAFSHLLCPVCRCVPLAKVAEGRWSIGFKQRRAPIVWPLCLASAASFCLKSQVIGTNCAVWSGLSPAVRPCDCSHNGQGRWHPSVGG